MLLLLVPTVAQAQLSNIQYTTNSDGNGGVIITGFSADGSGPLAIPSTINVSGSDLTVTGLGDQVFFQSQVITSVTIPNTVTSIGNATFYQCSSLTSVSIPASVTTMGFDTFTGSPLLTAITVDPSNPNFSSDVNGVLFDKNQTTLIQYPIGNAGAYTIPNTVTTIGDGSFAFAVTGPSGVTIPTSVTTIVEAAFFSCDSLTSVSIPSSVTSIQVFAFDLCTSLTAITVDPSNTAFSSDANGVLFDNTQTTLIQYPAGNTAASYTIPNGVTNLGDFAFNGCSNLTSVTIPNSVTSIGNSTFASAGLTSALFLGNAPTTGSGIFASTASGFTVDYYNGATGFTSPNWTDSSNDTYPATDLGSNPANFTTATTSGQITLTGWAIAGGPVGSLVIPSTINGLPVTGIAQDAFLDSTSLTSVSIPASVTSIGVAAFAGCTSLTAITVDPSNTTFSSDVNGVLFDINQTTLIQYPAGNTATNYTIPNSVTTFGFDAFLDSTSLTSVSIPASVTSIGASAFNGCTSLASVLFIGNAPTMGSGVFTNAASGFTIDYYNGATGFTSPNWTDSSSDTYPAANLGTNPAAFTTSTTSGQITLTGWAVSGGPGGSVIIPGTINGLPVTGIAASAFANSTSLTSVSIPASVTSIGAGAFIGCTSLTTITVDPSNANFSSAVGVLFNKNQTTLIQYPAGSAATSYTIPNGVPTTIGASAFSGSTSLTSVTVPSGVTTIGASAFASDTSLTTALFVGNAPTTGSGIFASTASGFTVDYYQGATGFTSPNWTDSASDTYPAANLETNPAAFTTSTTSGRSPSPAGRSGGPGGSVVIPGTINGLPVTGIAASAFANSTSLTSVAIPASVTSIGAGAFNGCTSLTAITVDPSNTAFSSASGVLFNKNQTTLIQYPEGNTATSYTIPSGVTGLGASAFAGNTSLTGVTIPASVTSIGASAFNGCTNLASALLVGNAPTTGSGIFASTASGFTVEYYNDATGFTSPNWTDSSSNTYPATNLGTNPADFTTTTTSGHITITGWNALSADRSVQWSSQARSMACRSLPSQPRRLPTAPV